MPDADLQDAERRRLRTDRDRLSAELAELRSELATVQNMVLQVREHAESWKMAGGVLAASEIARLLLDVTGTDQGSSEEQP